MKSHVLIIEDNESVVAALGASLVGRRITTAATKAEGLERFRRDPPDVVLLDVNLPDGDGLELLEVLLVLQPLTHVIVMTGDAEVSKAVRAMKLGAQDFIAKPFSKETIVEAVALSERSLPVTEKVGLLGLVGQSPTLLEATDKITRIAPSSCTVLVLGESGTGKELAARAIHLLSPRASRPFVTVNCAAITPSLLEAELFGYERGAFTGASPEGKKGIFEVAHGGTIVLDEIAETSPTLQATLLRTLEQRTIRRVGGVIEHSVDVRVVASTNRDIAREVGEGRFRADLYYRLAVVPISLPPLREREGDVAILAEHFLATMGASRPGPKFFTERARRALESHSWPGNVRELRNVVERAVLLAGSKAIDAGDLGLEDGLAGVASSGPSLRAAPPRRESFLLQDAERRLVLEALAHAGGSKTVAAQLLGIDRTTLYKKLKRIVAERETRRRKP